MNCTEEGQTVTTAKAGIKEVTASSKGGEQPRRRIYGRAKAGGHLVYMQTTGSQNEHLHMVMVLCDGPVEAVESIYFGAEEVTGGAGKWSNVTANVHLGGENQEADADLVAASGGQWTAAHTLSGICYIYVRISNWDPASKSPSPAIFDKVPDISAIVVSGSRNAAAAFGEFRSHRNLPPIDPASLAIAESFCGQLVGGLPRYTVGGIVESSASTEDVVRQFLASMQATLTNQSGRYFLTLGDAAPAPDAITWDHVVSAEITLSKTPGTAERVQATYQGDETNWTNTDAEGKQITNRSLKLDLVDNEAQAQRVQDLTNQGLGPQETLDLEVMTHWAHLTPGDAVRLDLRPEITGVFDVVATEMVIEATISVRLSLKRQVAFSDPATTARSDTEVTTSVAARIIPQPVVVVSGAALPYQVSASGPGDIRWKFGSAPVAPEDGSANQPVPYPVAGALLHFSAFRNGWAPSSVSVQLF